MTSSVSYQVNALLSPDVISDPVLRSMDMQMQASAWLVLRRFVCSVTLARLSGEPRSRNAPHTSVARPPFRAQTSTKDFQIMGNRREI